MGGGSPGKASPGIGEGSPRQAGISPGAESQRLGPAAEARSNGLVGYVRRWITALGSLSMLVSVQQEQRKGGFSC